VAALVETLEARVLLSSIVVNSTSDSPSLGTVTLRQAINTAGVDTITFDSTVFVPNVLTTITLTGGPLELTHNVTISGLGAGQVGVSGGNVTTVFKVDAGVTAEIDGLTITGGKASVNSAGVNAGGGIFNAGSLTLHNDVITANSAAGANDEGGGLFNSGTATVSVSGTTFSNNSAALGGGFFNSGNVTVTGGTFLNNSAATTGGGFYSLGTVTLTGTTLSHNTATLNGGGFFNNNVVTLTGSTLSNNTAQTGSGGGLFSLGGSLTVTQSTVADNTAPSGGGLFVEISTVTLTASTIADNFGTSGGGIDNVSGNVTLSGTIVAANTVSATNSAPSDWADSAANPSSSFNLIGVGGSSGLSNNVNGNIVGNTTLPVNPHLGPLADNGGPTQTLALLPGSAAIDAAGSTLPTDPVTHQQLTTDQRGTPFSRLVDGAVDIGAFEFSPAIILVAAPTVTYGQDGLVTVAVNLPNATGALSLFVDGSSTAAGTHTLTAADKGSFTFDVGIRNAGTHSLHAVYTATGALLSSTLDSSLVVNKANATINVTPYSVTYDGNAHTATGTATGVLGESLSGLDLTGTTHTNAGSYSDTWTFTDATGNYNNASGTVADSIGKANATINVTAYSVTYDGNAHTATGTAVGVLGEALKGLDLSGTTHTNAGSYSDTWTFTDATGNYNNASGTVADSIGKANATINVTAYSVTYDGNSHKATGTAVGVLAESLSGLDLSATSHTNAGDYSDTWTFTDTTGNYNNASGTVADSIGKANATINVTAYSVTYDGNAHTATGTAVGVLAEALKGLDLSGTTHTNANSYSDTWTFTDVTGNYSNASGTVADSIAKANATINVTSYSVPFDGNPHTATGTATGVKGESLSGLDLSATTHTAAGSYTDTWTFTDVTGNYNNASGTVQDTITSGTTTVKISITGYQVTYDGKAHTATGTATDANGTDLSGFLNLTGTTHTDAGTYVDAWTFVDPSGHFTNQQGTVNDVILKANAVITITPFSGIYDGAFHGATGSATGVGGTDLSAQLNLGATFKNVPGGSTAHWTFSGGTNYNDAAGDVSIDIIPRSLDAILGTASSINIAKNGSITFTLSSLNGIVDGQTVAELFDGAEFSLLVGSKLYSGTSTASVVDGTIYVSWQLSPELYSDLFALLNGGTPSSKTKIVLKVFAASLDGNYTLSEDVLTAIFQRGNVTFS
jgi:hypothetical protein